MSEAMSEVCRKFCHKPVASSGFQSIDQLIGCALGKDQPFFQESFHIPLEAATIDLRAKGLKILNGQFAMLEKIPHKALPFIQVVLLRQHILDVKQNS